MDKLMIEKKVQSIISQFKSNNGDVKCKVYVLHGNLTDEEMRGLYRHPKIKAFITTSHGEGFGLPLFEAAREGLPVVTIGWSGQLDFLHREYSFLVGGDLENVHESAAVKETLLKESKWFKPDDSQVGTVLKDSFKNYKKYLTKSRKHRKYTTDNFSYQKMVELVDSILTENVPEFAQQVQLNLPTLKLPKLQKIDG